MPSRTRVVISTLCPPHFDMNMVLIPIKIDAVSQKVHAGLCPRNDFFFWKQFHLSSLPGGWHQ